MNYDLIDDFSRSLNKSRIIQLKKIAGPECGPGFKNFGTGAKSESEKVTPAASDLSIDIFRSNLQPVHYAAGEPGSCDENFARCFQVNDIDHIRICFV